MKLLIIIPYVNEKSINKLVSNLKGYDVLIIDDSGKKNLKLKDVIIIHNKQNYGKGYSLRKGFKYAIDNKYDKCITMDADGEHPIESIKQIAPLLSNNDFIIGQRENFRSAKREKLNKHVGFWMRLLNCNMVDYSCGLNGYDTSFLRKLNLNSEGFDIEIEIILESLKYFPKKRYYYFKCLNSDIKSKVKFRDYLLINNRFDKWIIKNVNSFSISVFIKIFLIVSSFTGLLLGQTLLFVFKRPQANT